MATSSQQNSTDLIAKMAWDTLKTQWEAFFLLPLLVMVGVNALNYFSLDLLGQQKTILISILMIIAEVVFFGAFGTAMAKWCSELYSGKKEIDIASGLRFGLSRFFPLIWTWIVSFFKLCLWGMLFVLPGYYHVITYSQSFKITQLEGLSGGSTNRLSQLLVEESGFLRTLGNYSALLILNYLLFIPLILMGALTTILLTLITSPEQLEVLAQNMVFPFTVIISIGITAVTALTGTFGSYQYLIYRDENKKVFDAAKKAL